jgi:acetyl-CoA carboxylase carboxyl transferase subunit alpha
MGMTADRLKKLNLIDEIVPEPVGGAHRNPEAAAETIKAALIRNLDELEKLSADELRAQRNKRIDSFGVYSEAAN